MSKFFENCITLEDLKKLYHKLVKKFHPDISSETNATETMKAINAEYDIAFERVKNIRRNAKGETYTKETGETVDIYRDIINRIVTLPNIHIEICGTWIWVTGDTKPCKGVFTGLGFMWSRNKVAWYYHSADGYTKKNGKKFSLDEIRNMFGSTEVETAQVAGLSA